MRPIHLADLDKRRPVVVLTREVARDRLRHVTVAPITSRVRGWVSEVPVGGRNGLDSEGVITVDNLQTIQRSALRGQIGWLLDVQEQELTAAIHAAFDLDD